MGKVKAIQEYFFSCFGVIFIVLDDLCSLDSLLQNVGCRDFQCIAFLLNESALITKVFH